MSMELDVYVVDSDGDPIANARVTIFITGILKGGDVSEYTDDDGHAHIETTNDYEDSREVYIHVRDDVFGPYAIGQGSFTVEV